MALSVPSPVTAAPFRDPPSAGDFSLRLRDHEERRHASILVFDGPAPRSTLPPGWRAEDAFRAESRGFMPLAQAAEGMSASEDQVVELARRGILLAEVRGGTLYVQPAIVSTTAVVNRRSDW